MRYGFRGTRSNEEGVGEETEQGTVGIADEGVDGVDEALGAGCAEQQDEAYEDGTHRQMGTLTQPFVVGALHDVDTEYRGERGQGGVGAREGSGDNAENEEDFYQWKV